MSETPEDTFCRVVAHIDRCNNLHRRRNKEDIDKKSKQYKLFF